MEEWELHFNGAIDNGVSKEELRATLHVIAIYCGVPAGVACFRIAKAVFAERGMA
jgi:4-carboxymuconolactone decarboxylase